MKYSSRIFLFGLELLIAAAVAFARRVEGVALRSLRVGQAQVAAVRRLGVEQAVPEQGEDLDLDLEDILGAGRNQLVLDHNLPAGHLGEVDHSLSEDHILRGVDLDQVGNFLEDSLQVGDLLVGLALIVNWGVEVDAVALGVA